MGARTVLSFTAGIITLFATFIFAWLIIGGNYINGIGILLTLPDIFTNASWYATTWNVLSWVPYVIAGFLIWFLLSGVEQIGGVSNKAHCFIGAIMPLLVSMFLFGYATGLFPTTLSIYLTPFGVPNPIISDLLPIMPGIPGRPELIGVYLLLAGSVLSIISGFFSKKEDK